MPAASTATLISRIQTSHSPMQRRTTSTARPCIVAGSSIVAYSASGVTGAGNSPKRELLFGEGAGDFRAYGIGNIHRLLNEMRATLASWNADADLVFTPHLLPVARGILSTITVPLVA